MALLVSACSTSIEMMPVEGPLAAQRPLQIVRATAESISGNSGKLTIHMAGEDCVGRWSSVAPTATSVTSGGLWGTYGSLTGMAVTSGNVPGVNRGEAFAVCPSGNSIQAEFFTGSGTANGYGVAKDTNGNIFRMLF